MDKVLVGLDGRRLSRTLVERRYVSEAGRLAHSEAAEPQECATPLC